MDETRTPAEAGDGIALPIASKADKGFLREAIELKERHVPMPEWGRTIIVRELTAAQNREYQISNVRFDKGGNPKGMVKEDVDLRLVIRACVDGNGVRVFTEDDIPLLRKQPASVVSRLTRIAKELSGLGDDDDVPIEDREEREKND